MISHTLASLAAQMRLMQSAAANSRICLPSGEVRGVNARVFVHREQRRFADSETSVFWVCLCRGCVRPLVLGCSLGPRNFDCRHLMVSDTFPGGFFSVSL